MRVASTRKLTWSETFRARYTSQRKKSNTAPGLYNAGGQEITTENVVQLYKALGAAGGSSDPHLFRLRSSHRFREIAIHS